MTDVPRVRPRGWEIAMTDSIYAGLKQLGSKTDLPQSPEEAVLERVANPHPGDNYLVRFAAPEFTSRTCMTTVQPRRAAYSRIARFCIASVC